MRKIAHLARDNKTNRFLATTGEYDSLGEILGEVDDFFAKR
jgi:hypothetical protein